MREVSEVQFGPWTSPSIEIDLDGKLVGAVPGTPNNWDRWFRRDQRGTLNLLTEERVARAATLVRRGARFSLALPIGRSAPSGRAAPLHLSRYAASDVLSNDPGMDPWGGGLR